MEFDQMKKIWNSQKQEYMYSINQSALQNHVIKKQKQGLHITNISEWLMIVVNTIAPVFIIVSVRPWDGINVSMMILAGWMFFTAAFIAHGRYRRVNGNSVFDRTINGDLQFAIDVARYQVRIASLGRWNIAPIGVLSVTGLLEAEKPIWIAGVLVAFLFLANYVAGWENSFYKSRLTELEGLKKKLEEEA